MANKVVINDNVFSNFLESNNVSGRQTIYKSEIFGDGLRTKATRTKLRAKRDKYWDMVYQKTDFQKPNKQVFEAWNDYAKNVYNDVFVFFESNTSNVKFFERAAKFLKLCQNEK